MTIKQKTNHLDLSFNLQTQLAAAIFVSMFFQDALQSSREVFDSVKCFDTGVVKALQTNRYFIHLAVV